jgi:protein-disulfide isomerase
MGKGKEMLDGLFQAQWVNKTPVMESQLAIEEVAANIGIDSEFKAKLEGNEAKQAALENLELMRKYGVQGTPTVIINGNLLVEPPTIENLDAVIGSLLS